MTTPWQPCGNIGFGPQFAQANQSERIYKFEWRSSALKKRTQWLPMMRINLPTLTETLVV